MRHSYLYFISAALLAAGINAAADEPLQNDPDLRTGVLSNGLTYYILPNRNPEKKADFYFVENAGAVLERDDQNGLAHMTEHMGFRGTAHFPGRSLSETVTRYGMAAATNINAWTTRDETVYYLTDVPTDMANAVDTVLLMLHDWSGSFTFDEKELAEERGVVIEEWRMRKNSSWRLENQYDPILFNGSKYGDRDILGDLEVLRNPDSGPLRDFYNRWYHPDRQAVIIVGDFDADAMEKKVKTMFSTLPKPEKPTVAPEYPVPHRDGTDFALATDSEETASEISFRVIRDNFIPATESDYTKTVAETFLVRLLENRLKELVSSDATLMASKAGIYSLVRGYRVLSCGVTVPAGKEKEGLSKLVTELERIRRYGFTEDELDYVRKTFLAEISAARKSSYETRSNALAEHLVDVFLEGCPQLENGYEYGLKRKAAEVLTTDDIRKAARDFRYDENSVLVVTGPDTGMEELDKKKASEITEKVKRSDISPYIGTATENILLQAGSLPGGKIVSEKKLPLFDAVEWTMQNGAKVIYARSDREKGKVDINGLSFGGYSRIPDSLLTAAAYTDRFVHKFGLGNLDANALRRTLAGKDLFCFFSIGELNEAVYGNSSAKDLETFMQLLYLRFEAPRFDEKIFEALREKEAVRLEAEADSPQKTVSDSLRLASVACKNRVKLISADDVRSIKLSQIEKIYRDRIQDASDFTFIFTGDISADTLRTLTEKYIGSLHSTWREDGYIDRGLNIPAGRTHKEVYVGNSIPKASVKIYLSREMEFSPKSSLYTKVLQDVLGKRLTSRIREREGGTYGIYTRGWENKRPRENTNYTIEFQCDPIRLAQLKEAVFQEIELVTDDEVKEDEIRSTVMNLYKTDEQRKNYNSYVSSALISFIQDGYNPWAPENYNEILDSVTPAALKDFAAKAFDGKTDIFTFTSSSKTTQ